MNRKIQYDSIKWVSPELGQGIVKGNSKVIEGLAAEIKTGHYTAFTIRNVERHKLERKNKRSRYKKNVAERQKVDGAYIDRILAGVSLGDKGYG